MKVREVVSQETVFSLWAGYGSIIRITAKVIDQEEKESLLHLIVKSVDPPHDPENTAGHQRKLDSYLNEIRFYGEVAPALYADLTPRCFYSQSENNQFTIVMADAKQSYPIEKANGQSLTLNQTEAAVRWLAKFHGRAMGK